MTIDILVAFDSKYEPLTGVMLTSLFNSNKHHEFNIHAFVGDDFGASSEKKFRWFITRHHSSLFVYNLQDFGIITRCPLNPNSHITRSTYYRLLAPEILPKTIEKILYLDGDIIVNGDISRLWLMDLEGFAFAGADDCSFVLKDNYSRLQYDRKYGYYNAGVTLYNIKYWRENNLSKLIFSYIESHESSLTWLDQDAVNAFLYDKRKKIPIQYNFQTFFFMRTYWNQYAESFRKEVLSAAKDPVLIHYIGHAKPWIYRYYGYPFFKLWRKTAFYSIWWKSFIPHIDISYIKFIILKYFWREKVLRNRNKDMVEVSYSIK